MADPAQISANSSIFSPRPNSARADSALGVLTTWKSHNLLVREAAMLVLHAAWSCQKMAAYEEPGLSCCQNFPQLQDWIAQAFSAKLSLSGWLHGKCSRVVLRCAARGTSRCAASSLRGPFALQSFLSGDNSGFTWSVVDPIRFSGGRTRRVARLLVSFSSLFYFSCRALFREGRL